MRLRDTIQQAWAIVTGSEGHHPRAIRWIAVVTGILMTIYTTQRAQLEFHHDSLYYWELGRSFIAGHTFSFTNFSDGLRGYLFPFLLFVVQWQASLLGIDPKLLFSVYSALLFTVISIHLVHRFIEWVFGWKANIAARLTLVLLLFYFWRGHFLYPLTDFPSLAALLAAIIFLVKGAAGGRWQWFILAGIFAGAAMNIRPIYQVSVIAILVFIPFLLRGQGMKSITLSAAAFISGCVLILAPQVMINKVRHDTISPLVLAHYVGEDSIYEVQLFWGLKTQKYETNVGDNYPWAGVVYAEPLVLDLPREASRERTLSNYLRIVSRNPLEMSMMYFRHAFNGLDIFYPTPYVRNIFAGHSFLSLFNYIIWFVFFRYLLGLRPIEVTSISWMGAAALILPVAAAVPTVIEVRFFLPVYLLAYAVICRVFSVNGILAGLRENPWSLMREFLLCAIWIILCFSLSAATVGQLVL